MVQVVDLVQPVFATLPLEFAMPTLVSGNASNREGGADQGENPYIEATHLVAHLDQELNHYPSVLAGLWLYVDDLERSHAISQSLNDPTGAFWHGIMHRREGDFTNAKYWLRQVGKHPALATLDFNPLELVDKVAEGSDREYLLHMQRREWKALFDFSLQESQ